MPVITISQLSVVPLLLISIGTSMATPHVCGLVAALMTKGGKYSDVIKDDASLREVLNEEYVRDIGVKGPDNETGLGFLSYLDEKQHDELWNATPFWEKW
jgi:subtilisin family serine protease